jgi:hypothetical protein
VPSFYDETAALPTGQPAAAPPEPHFASAVESGEVGKLGPYRIVKVLGRGGMGAVYAAIDTRLGRKLALKVMLPQYAADANAKERFLREARAAAQITHDNVVTVYEADERDGIPYIAMQFLEGCPLDEYLKTKGSPSIPQILRIAREAAAGLAAAHKIGLVHRDIKPGNLWLEAPEGRVKVLDFGLAKPVDAEVELTKSGAIVGTPAYMSPEQARGEKIDHRTDLFSLGALLYRLCADRLPFEGPTTMSVLTALAVDEPPPVRELNPSVSEPLAALIHQLLAKKPANRPASAAEVVKSLQAIAQGTAPESRPLSALMHVTALPAANPFAELNLTEADAPLRQQAKQSARKKPRSEWPWVAALSAGVLLVVLAGLIIIIRNQDGTETKIEVPTGATVTMKDRDGKTVAQVGPDRGRIEPGVINDADRQAAEWVLALGGSVGVTVNGQGRLIKAVADLPKEKFTVVGVNLQGMPVTDGGLANLKNLKGLTELHLEGTAVTDSGLSSLKGLAGLEHLWLDKTKVTNAGLVHLKGCQRLHFLWLNGTAVTDPGLVHLKELRSLARLFLDATAVTDSGLAHLKDCKKLTKLSLQYTKVTDGGLAHLKELNSLTVLMQVQTKVTEKGLADFHAAVPGCKIEHDGGVIEPKVAGFSALDPIWLQHVQALKPKDQVAAVAEELKRRNPKFDLAQITAKIERDRLTYVHVITEEVTDVTPVRVFDKLERLNLAAQYGVSESKLADLRPLTGLPLRDLNLMCAPLVTNLEPLRGMPLETLNVSHSGVVDFAPLKDAPLRDLTCRQMLALRSLDSLRGFKLTSLDCAYNTSIVDLKPLEGMPLVTVRLHATRVKDLSPLAKSPLEEVNCGNGTAITDLTTLRGVKTLRRLYVSMCPCVDIRPLAGMPLEHLHMSDKVTDLTPLQGMPLVEVVGPFDPKRDAELLKSIKTLKKINHKPAAEFLGQAPGDPKAPAP